MKKSILVTILTLSCLMALVLTCVQPKGDLTRNNPLDPSSSNYQPPIISAQPQPVTVYVGDRAVLSVAATGSALSYQWQKDSVDISGATSDSLVLTAALQTNQGNYKVIITNAKGSVTSNAVILTVNLPLAAPVITTQPQLQTVTAGQSATFAVTAIGNPAPTYQWKKNGTDISGATSVTYSISSVQIADSGTYSVTITNSQGIVTSGNALLKVLFAPIITGQPQSQSVLTGQAATFSVAANGNPAIAYQWKKDGTDISGATSSTYSITTAQVADAGTYTVVVSNSVGNVVSDAATLTVTTSAVAPTIISQPQSQTVMAGQSVTLSASATGTGTLSYQWLKDGVDISGATANTYSIPNVQNTSAGTYTVAVTNSVGSVTSLGAVLTVSAAPVAPSIDVQPQPRTITAGQTVTFSVTATGSGQLSYQWKKDGTAISGATASSYSITNVQGGNAGTYSVVVSNSVGNTVSSDAALTVTAAAVAPAITVQPASQTITAGQSVTFTVTATGTAPLSYQWKNGGTDISGATTNSYSITNVQNSNAGTYTVTVSNSAGNVTSNGAVLTVSAAVVPPTISSDPQSQTVTAGQSVTFTVVASGAGTLTYYWVKDGTAISGATSSSLILSNVQSVNAGTYWVIVTNTAGNVRSNGAVLTVSAATMAPSITTQPQSQTITLGKSVTFSVTATGTAPLSYQWYIGGTAISGATSSTYSISNVQASNAGTYTVTVSNGTLPNATSNGAVLTVSSAPVAPSITVQPQSQTITAGQSVTFSVTATGTAPLSYQWYISGSAISGATSSTYSISNVQAANAGTYTVMVSNGTLPNATSNGAVLTVSAAIMAPSITVQPQSQTITAGQSVTFSVTATGTAPLSYQWYIGGTAISGATSSSYSISNVQAANAGTYTVTVSNGTLPNATSNGAKLAVKTIDGKYTDIDGNAYDTIAIGTQVWMVENLKTTKYNDGNPIPLVTDSASWAALTTPGYCWYKDSATYGNTYGALYNWYSVNTGKLAPIGWHVSTDSEWTVLTTFLGGVSVAGGKLKEAGTAHWALSPIPCATNETGFTALPGGLRDSNCVFRYIHHDGYWWSPTKISGSTTCRAMDYYEDTSVYGLGLFLRSGCSIRCVRDP
jgi:large repetitive protein